MTQSSRISWATAVVAALAATSAAPADRVLIDQPFDWTARMPSVRRPIEGGSRTADDFRLDVPETLTRLEAAMWFLNEEDVLDWEVELYSNAGGLPGNLLTTIPGGESGEILDDCFEGGTVVRVAWDLGGLALEPGRYWICARAVTHAGGSIYLGWGAANTGNVNWREAHFKSDFWGFPNWTSSTELYGSTLPPLDAAFTLYAEGLGPPPPDQWLRIAALPPGSRYVAMNREFRPYGDAPATGNGGGGIEIVLAEQAFDWWNGLASERDTFVDLASTADDIKIDAPVELSRFEAAMIVVPDPGLVEDWELELYTNDGGRPGTMFHSTTGGSIVAIAGCFAGHDVVIVSWELDGLTLEPGRYWVVVRGVGGFCRVFWGLANTGDPEGKMAHFKSETFGFPQWSPIMMILDEETDTAWTLLAKHPGANPTGDNVIRGEHLEGGLADLVQSDGNIYKVRSQRDNAADGAHVCEVLVKFKAMLTDPGAMSVSIESRFTAAGGTLNVRLKNWVTGGLDDFGTWPVGTENSTIVFGVGNPADYIRPDNGKIKMRVTSRVVAPEGISSFKAIYDLVRVTLSE